MIKTISKLTLLLLTFGLAAVTLPFAAAATALAVPAGLLAAAGRIAPATRRKPAKVRGVAYRRQKPAAAR